MGPVVSGVAVTKSLLESNGTVSRAAAPRSDKSWKLPPPDIKPLRWYEMVTVISTVRRAFLQDSLTSYFRQADAWPAWNRLLRFPINLLRFSYGIYQGRIVTIDRGAGAMIQYSAPGDVGMPWIVSLIIRLLGLLRTKGLAKRQDEVGEKIREMVQGAFGDRVKEMYEIQGLSAAPEAQGRGYGTALVEHVLKKGEYE
ncbi:hypothetical protein BD310DRAFT_480517 [Dichomitus squalens]|uniref:N-acetyltransferase domain-containing protein n=1 Tax=Dichomitus squalens TaxID=114155 RepID=A0A4Q9PV39_9APHY|nr:hypothetical protein BD310DRAFT_480517 [Dichomitus squalens]